MTYKMPLITSWSSARGLPVRADLGNERLMRFHCESVRSDRYALRGKDIPNSVYAFRHELNFLIQEIAIFLDSF